MVPIQRSGEKKEPEDGGSEPKRVLKILFEKHPKIYLALSIVGALTSGLLMLLILLYAGPRIWDWGIETWYTAVIAVIVIGFIVLFCIGILSFAAGGAYNAILSFLEETPTLKSLKQAKDGIKTTEEGILNDLDERLGIVTGAEEPLIGTTTEELAKSVSLAMTGMEERVIGVTRGLKKVAPKGITPEDVDTKKLRDLRDIFKICMFHRKQLDYYYQMNLHQTTTSFRCSLVAMFAGFFIIAIGVASSFGLLEILFPDFTPTNINDVVIAGGVVAELISALFLWIYMASTKQLMFFYRNQAFAYGVLTSFKIADTMNESGDSTKLEIIKSYLASLNQEPTIELPKSTKK